MEQPPTARAPLDQAAAAQTLKADRHPRIQFTFLGFTFRPRRAKGRDGKCWTNILPAVGAAAMKRMYEGICEWHLPRQTSVALHELAAHYNPTLRGWLNY
jgi:hypothetical protein